MRCRACTAVLGDHLGHGFLDALLLLERRRLQLHDFAPTNSNFWCCGTDQAVASAS
jgi:hypothetical protein